MDNQIICYNKELASLSTYIHTRSKNPVSLGFLSAYCDCLVTNKAGYIPDNDIYVIIKVTDYLKSGNICVLNDIGNLVQNQNYLRAVKSELALTRISEYTKLRINNDNRQLLSLVFDLVLFKIVKNKEFVLYSLYLVLFRKSYGFKRFKNLEYNNLKTDRRGY